MPRKKSPSLKGAAAATIATAAIGKYLDNHPEVIESAGRKAKKAVNIGLILFGVSIVSIAGVVCYKLYWKNRFKKMEYSRAHKPVSISEGLAKSKADIIYTAMKGVGANYDRVYNALKGMGYNNYVAIYNAFGKRRPATSLSLGNAQDLTLSEWIINQFGGIFDGNKLASLRAQVGSEFF